MTILCALLILGALLTAACSGPTCYEIKRPNGQIVCLPKCEQIIEYQAASFSIKGTNIPIPLVNTTVNIGDMVWNKSVLQAAASASQVLDIQRVSRCERMSVIATSVSDQKEYENLLKTMYENEEKINQLALLITMNNPEAVVNWINAYSTEIAANAIDTALAGPHLSKAQPLVRSLNHQIFIPKDVKVRSIDSLIQ